MRVSTDRQAEEGESLGAQERTIQGYAMMHGLKLDRVFVERAVSGSRPIAERPEGGKLMAAARAGDVIITPKLDRMFRSAVDALDVLARLKDRGVSLHMIDLGGDVTGNGISKLVFTILSAVAEAERDRTRERIADMKRDQRSRGRYLGGAVPFGFRLGEQGELRARTGRAGCDPTRLQAQGPGGIASGDRVGVEGAGVTRSPTSQSRTFSGGLAMQRPSLPLRYWLVILAAGIALLFAFMLVVTGARASVSECRDPSSGYS